MPLRFLLILGSLSAFGPLAIDFYLPAFPQIAKTFATDTQHVQISLAVYFAGVAIGQLLYGPLADRFGRRPPLLAGLLLFCAASLACALAPSLNWLIGARFVQALGGCVGMVIPRAVVRDHCDTLTCARVFSQLMLVMGVAPILAPLGGGALLSLFGWPSIFWCLTLFGALCTLAVIRWLPESLPQGEPRRPLRHALSGYLHLLRDGVFIGHVLTGGLVLGGMFSYIAGSPFVFIEFYGVKPEHYGWLFGSNAAGFILVGQLNAKLLYHHSPDYWLRRALWLHLGFAALLFGVTAWQPNNLWPLLAPLFLCIASLGCILPNTTACAMSGQGHNAGSASGLLGSLQFCLAAGAVALLHHLHNGSVLPLGVVITLCALAAVAMAQLTHRLERRRLLNSSGAAS